MNKIVWTYDQISSDSRFILMYSRTSTIKKNVSFLKNPSKFTKFKLKLKLCESDKIFVYILIKVL